MFLLELEVIAIAILIAIIVISSLDSDGKHSEEKAEEKRETELKPQRYVAVCPCGGEYEFTGIVLTSNPPLYVHECCRCHLRTNLKSKSPEVRYEQKKEVQ